MFLLLSSLIACGPKKPSSEVPFLWPTDRELKYSAEFQQTGAFRSSGSADLNTNINLIFDISCQAQPKEGRIQKMTCTIPAEVISLGEGTESFNGEINLEWKGQTLTNLDVEGVSDSMTTVFQSVFGAMEFDLVPDLCQVDLSWKDKSPLPISKIHGLNGPASYRSEYIIEECTDKMHIKSTSTISLSAMVTDNSSAPTFSFQGTGYTVFDRESKMLLSRQHNQVLQNSSTSLGAGMIKQSVSLKMR